MWSRTKGAARTAALAVLAMSIFWTAIQLHAEPLLACVLAGIITINRQCGPRSLRLVYLQSLLSPHACSGFWLLTVVFQQAQNGVAIVVGSAASAVSSEADGEPFEGIQQTLSL